MATNDNRHGGGFEDDTSVVVAAKLSDRLVDETSVFVPLYRDLEVEEQSRQLQVSKLRRQAVEVHQRLNPCPINRPRLTPSATFFLTRHSDRWFTEYTCITSNQIVVLLLAVYMNDESNTLQQESCEDVNRKSKTVRCNSSSCEDKDCVPEKKI